jgi:hypothetical protein
MRLGSLLLVIGCAAHPAPDAPTIPGDPRLALQRQLAGPTPLMADLGELCDRIGGRITGSPEAERSVSWAADKLRGLGLDSVRVEGYPMPFLWLPGIIEVAATAPEAFAIPAVSAPGTGSTAAPVEARLVDGGFGSLEDLGKLGDRATGAFVLVRSTELNSLDDLFAEVLRTTALLGAATEAKVAGLVLQSNRPRGLLYADSLSIGRQTSPLPVVLVSREHAQRLARLSEHSEVRLRINVVNRVGPSFEAHNVVADLRGSERPDEIVVLGAHLDSWALGTGAEDNGINVALVIDVARAFRALGIRPRRTLRFVLFTGEEQGLWGSTGYVESHRSELPNHTAAIIYDIGSGRTHGFYLSGRPELRAPVANALSSFPEMAAQAHPLDGIDGTDNFPFLLSGIPNLVAAQDTTAYLRDYHAASDVVERVNVREARRNAALAAALMWWFADTKDTGLRQQTRAEVDELLTATKLDAQMKAFGQWDDWQHGMLGFPAANR